MAPTAQKPLVGHFDWPAINPPQNSSRPLHHPHSSHYESPFQQVDMRPGMLRSTKDFVSERLAALSAHLSRQPVVLTVFLVACAIALLALALFLCGAKRRLESRQRHLHECRRHFDYDEYDDYDDEDFDQGFLVREKEQAPGPAGGESLWSETLREFGLKAGGGGADAQGAAAAASLKLDMPPFHVSVHLT